MEIPPSVTRREPVATRPPVERAGVVGVFFNSRDRSRAEESLDELQALAEAAGAQVLVQTLQERPAPDPAYYVGRGKVEELRTVVESESLDLLVFDEELSPGQQRNLENRTECKILDRTQLILDIFARRAHTREGKLQVELAQLNYLLPRLAGKGTMLSRLGGGIGTRGPGETKLEMDRRRIRNRIALLRRELERVATHRTLQRAKRQGVPLPIVALVGYTNAGKSTLFNALTRSAAVESNQLFATLDPLLRRMTLPNALEIVVSDTVGFVSKLPHDIVAAFRATLEEVRAADLLLHVVDISNPGWRDQADAVNEVLRELGVQNTPTIELCNKADKLPAGSAPPGCQILVSAKLRTGLEPLVDRIVRELEAFSVRVELKIPYSRSGLVSMLHDQGKVRSEEFEDDGIRIEVELPRSTARSMREFLIDTTKPGT
jgi:GTPase